MKKPKSLMSLSTKMNRFTFHKLALETMNYKDGQGDNVLPS